MPPVPAVQPRLSARELRRPALLPGLVRLRRDATSLQLGVELPHAVVLSGLTPGHRALLGSLDGRLDQPGLNALAAQVGLGSDDVTDLLELLAERGLLVDAEGGVAPPGRSDDERARLAPDLVSLSLQHRADPQPGAVLQHRQGSWIDVRGAGRVGSAIAVLLGAAGVGRVTVADSTPAVPADRGPAGVLRFDPGSSRELATREQLRAFAPSVRLARRAGPVTPDLVVLAPDAGPDATLVTTWARRSTPHLLAFVRETTGVVGPLVVPGQTACLVCLDLHRRDRDPGWPTVVAQLGSRTSQACDVALATLVAAQAAMQVLAYLGGAETAVRDGTLETTLGSGMTRRRSWRPHPTCGCGWAQMLDQPPEAPAR